MLLKSMKWPLAVYVYVNWVLPTILGNNQVVSSGPLIGALPSANYKQTII